jgi:hypothetical protein
MESSVKWTKDEYRHYYPFGMQIEALGYTSGIDLPNQHLYNGKELQPDYGVDWVDLCALTLMELKNRVDD